MAGAASSDQMLDDFLGRIWALTFMNLSIHFALVLPYPSNRVSVVLRAPTSEFTWRLVRETVNPNGPLDLNSATPAQTPSSSVAEVATDEVVSQARPAPVKTNDTFEISTETDRGNARNLAYRKSAV